MEYPCGINYWGCNMTKNSNCEDCYYKSIHRDMGASWNVCTLHKDLSSATIACENSDNCKSKITYKEVNQAIEKQIPKKATILPIKVQIGKNEFVSYVQCPNCKSAIIKTHEKQKHCCFCGQAIDWSDKQ